MMLIEKFGGRQTEVKSVLLGDKVVQKLTKIRTMESLCKK